jgi:Flp pilus assembly protein TadG
MTRKLQLIRCDEHGSTVVEFAFAMPVLASLLYGLATLGMFFEANAGIQHALGQGARYGNLCLDDTAGTCTLPTSTDIKKLVNSSLYGAASGDFDAPTVDTSTASNGYITVTVTYHHTLSFLFFNGPTETLTRSKRVYLADTPPTQATCTSATTPQASCSIYN